MTTLMWLNVVSAFGSFITVALGIGGGALVLAVMASLLPPAALIPVHGIVQLGSNFSRTALLLPHVAWPQITGFLIGSVIGAALGGLVVIELSPKLVQIGVGVFVIWSVFSKPPQWLTRWPWITGILSSFLTMFFGATGLFVAGFTKALGLPRHAHVATHGAMMAFQHGIKVLVFALLGFAFWPWLGVIASLIASGFIGTILGRRMLGRLSEAGFNRALDVVLVLISLRLIWAGLTG